jgi:hypothetical protein
VLGALLFGAVMAAAGNASAQVAVNNPFGGAQATARIGHDPGDNGEWVAWQNNATGACYWIRVGNTGTGLNNDYYVQAGPNNDRITIVSGGTPSPWCGFTLQGLNYAGHHLDLLGGSGNDWLYSGTGNTWQYGYGGMDLLKSDGGLSIHMLGGDGNDSLVVTNPTNQGTFQSEAGDDCLLLNTSSTTPTVDSCGAGSHDIWNGPGTRPSDCESTLPPNPPGGICPWLI